MSDDAASDMRAKKIARHMREAETISASFGLDFIDAGEGWARASMTIRADMLNGHGFAHGGAIFTLADTAFGWACNSRNAQSYAQNASISFLSKVQPGERLTAEAKEETIAGRSGAYTVRVTADDGRVVAIFHGLSRSGAGKVIEEEGLSDG